MEVTTTTRPDDRPPHPGMVRERRIDTVHAEIGEVCGHLNALHGRLVGLVATILDDDLWQQSGIRSPEHWATWQLGVSATTARRLVAAARRRHELPATMAALDAGELTLDQITPIVDTAPTWADDRIANLARYATVTQIRRIARSYPHPSEHSDLVEAPVTSDDDNADSTGIDMGRADPVITPPDPPLEPSTPHDAHGPIDPHRADGIDLADIDTADPERFGLVQQSDGSWRLSGRLDADHGHLLDAALREIADRSFADHGVRPTRAAALVTLAEHHLGNLDPARRSRYRVHYTIDEHHQLVDPHGITLAPWLRELITCDADTSIIWQRHGTPIARTAPTSEVPGHTRRHVLRRDQRRCRLCGAPGHHIHHIRHREHGGTHHPSNLVLLCGPCHRLHHRGVITIAGNPDLADDRPGALSVTDSSTGRTLRPNALVRPPTGPPPPPSGTYRHPTGERLEPRWIDFDPPPTRTTTNHNAA